MKKNKEGFAKRYNKIFNDKRLSIIEKELLIDYIDSFKKNGPCFGAADSYYAVLFGMKRETVSKHRNELEKKGLIVSLSKKGKSIEVILQQEAIKMFFGLDEDIFK